MGDHLIFRRTKGGISEKLWKDSKGTFQICLDNEDDGGRGGSRKLSIVIRGDHVSKVTFKGGRVG